MRSYIHILIVFIVSFAFQANDGFACGNASNETTTACAKSGKSCCESDSETKKDNCTNCGDDCGGNCGNSSCQCAHSASAPFLELRVLEIVHNFDTLQNCWNYIQNPPKPIYLAIWTPPKIA